MTLQRAAPDRLSVQGCQNEVTARRREVRRRGGCGERRIEAGFEPYRQFLEVALNAVLGGRTVRVLHGEADGAAAEQALNGPHGREQRRAWRVRQGVEERRSRLVRQAIQQRQLLAASGREPHETHSSIARRGGGADQSLCLELSQQAAGVARVQGEAGTQLANFDTIGANLEEEAASAEGAIAAEKALLQRADLQGHDAIEAPDLGDALHMSDVSQRYRRQQGARSPTDQVGRSGHSASGLAGSDCSGPSRSLLIAANTKFSGGTGAPASRRMRTSCPAWVIASANGPWSSCSSVIPRSGAPAARRAPSSWRMA